MFPAMKMTEPYSPTARAKARPVPVTERRQDGRHQHAREGLHPRGAERGGGLFVLAVELDQNGLQRAHDEGEPDEGERDEDAERRVGDLQAERREEASDPAIRRVERRERDTGDGCRQRERKIDQRVELRLAGKGIAHHHPGDDQAEHAIDERGERGDPERDAQRRKDARIGDDLR